MVCSAAASGCRMNVKSDKYHESNGTSIENTGNGNILTQEQEHVWLTSKNGKKYAVCGSVQTIWRQHWFAIVVFSAPL